MPLYDYRCPVCCVTEEHLVADLEVVVECVRCELAMSRQFPQRVGLRMGAGAPSSEGDARSGGDLYDYDRADLHGSASYATEASYDVLRKSGVEKDRARAASKEAGPGMIAAGEALISNQEAAGER